MSEVNLEEQPLTPRKVAGFKIPCHVERSASAMFIPIEIEEDDPIFTTGGGYSAPVSKKLGLTVCMRKFPSPEESGYGRFQLDNQVATYLMIETGSGFAKPIWQTNVGSVIVAREDKKPLVENHLEALWSYSSTLLDRYGDCNPEAVDASITRENFAKFWKYNYNQPRTADILREWDNSQ